MVWTLWCRYASPPPVIEPRFLGCPTRSLVIKPTELSRHLIIAVCSWVLRLSGQFRSTKVSWSRNVYRDFWCKHEVCSSKYFIRKLKWAVTNFARDSASQNNVLDKCQNITCNDISSTLITSIHFFPSQHIHTIPTINYNFLYLLVTASTKETGTPCSSALQFKLPCHHCHLTWNMTINSSPEFPSYKCPHLQLIIHITGIYIYIFLVYYIHIFIYR